MANKIRFEEWKPEAILRSDLPAGVRFCCTPMSAGLQEFVASEDGRSVQVVSCGKPCYRVLGDRGGSKVCPVTILDWPEWCGPRPDAEPTLIEAVNRIGDDGVVAVVATNGYGEVETFDSADADHYGGQLSAFDSKYTVLGFLVSS